METIANKCNIIKNVGNSQTNSEINASVVGENILKAAFPQIIGFSIEQAICAGIVYAPFLL